MANDARALAESLNAAAARCITIADEDEAAYAALQASWKDASMSAEDKAKVEAAALDVPVKLVRLCHEQTRAVEDFLPKCNPNITSDAKVAAHPTAAAAAASPAQPDAPPRPARSLSTSSLAPAARRLQRCAPARPAVQSAGRGALTGGGGA